MSREIKFRAWDIENNCFFKPTYEAYLGRLKDISIDLHGNILRRTIEMPAEHISKGEIYILSQYTGLKDKNGKEIYEGDIVKQTYHAQSGSYDDVMTFDGHHIGEVIITASKGACLKNPLCYLEETDETIRCNQYKGIAGYRCEIIGNIYEHPHLLYTHADR